MRLRDFAPSLINRYVMRHFISKFLVMTLGLLGLIYLITFVEMLRKLSDSEQGDILQTLYLSFAQLPPVIDKVFPFFILLSVLWSIFSLLKTSELTIIKASSMSLWHISFIYCASAFTISVIYVFGLMPYLTQMYQEFKEWEDNRSLMVYNIYKKIHESESTNTVFLKADAFNPENNHLENVSIFFLDADFLVEKIYHAQQAYYKPTEKKIYFKALKNIKTAQEKLDPIQTIQDYQLSVNLEDVQQNYKPRNILYHVYEYPKLIKNQKEQDLSTTQMEIAYYSLFTLPFSSALYALIALVATPALYRGLKGSRYVILAIAGGILFYICDGSFILLASSQSLPISVILGTTKLLALLICIVIMFNKEYGLKKKN